MWSRIIKPEEDVVEKHIKKEDTVQVVPIIKGEQLRFRKNINTFIDEYGDTLDIIYKNCFKDYDHISKKDFYIFAYANTRK
jgi:hypothetical protein